MDNINHNTKSFAELQAEYDMAIPSRHVRDRRLPSGGAAGDYHLRNEVDYYNSIELSRDLCRNDALINQLVERSTTNEVQEGFNLEPQTGDKFVNEAITEYWDGWANDPELCDIAGSKTFNDYELQSSRANKRDGDCLITCLDSGHLQFHEGHYVGTNRRIDDVFLGVLRNGFRKALGYYLSTDLLDPYATTNRGSFGSSETFCPTYNQASGLKQCFHVFDERRVTMTRGVTACAPIMKMAAMFEDINFAKMVQQQLASAFVILRKRSALAGGGITSNVSYGEGAQSTSALGQIMDEDGVRTGMEVTSQPGEEISAFTSNIPNAEYFMQVRLLMQLMGINFGLPLCLVLMDGSETNFSGWRGAVDEARKGFRINQRNSIRKFHTPCYKIKLDHFGKQDRALGRALGKLKIPSKHTWHPQAWPYIEPVRDAEGDLIQVRNGLISPRRIQARNGRRHSQIVEETVEDNSESIRAAMKEAAAINAENPTNDPVHWRELISMPTPDGVQTNIESKGLGETDE